MLQIDKSTLGKITKSMQGSYITSNIGSDFEDILIAQDAQNILVESHSAQSYEVASLGC